MQQSKLHFLTSNTCPYVLWLICSMIIKTYAYMDLNPSISNPVDLHKYWSCPKVPDTMNLCKSVVDSVQTREDSIQKTNLWNLLIGVNCSAYVKEFFCWQHAPICMKSHQDAPVPSCFELCERVKNDCMPTLQQFRLSWPEESMCSKFPKSSESICLNRNYNKTNIHCKPCRLNPTHQEIISEFCKADVALKAQFLSFSSETKDFVQLRLKLGQSSQVFKMLQSDGTVIYPRPIRKQDKRIRRKRKYNPINRRTRWPPAHWRYGQQKMSREFNQPLPNRFQQHRFEPSRSRVRRPRNADSEENKEEEEELTRTKRNVYYRRNYPTYQRNPRRLRRRNQRYRKRRDYNDTPELYGLKEVLIACPNCNVLPRLQYADNSDQLAQQRWLVMGRRIKAQGTNQYLKDKIQVTFITQWRRNDVAFKQTTRQIKRHDAKSFCAPKVMSMPMTRRAAVNVKPATPPNNTHPTVEANLPFTDASSNSRLKTEKSSLGEANNMQRSPRRQNRSYSSLNPKKIRSFNRRNSYKWRRNNQMDRNARKLKRDTPVPSRFKPNKNKSLNYLNNGAH